VFSIHNSREVYMLKIRLSIFVIVGLLVGWSGYSLYCYFLDATSPVVLLQGIEDNGSYAGDVQCVLAGSDGYKVANVSIWIDQKPLVTHHIINKKEFEYVFPVATKALSDGKHALKIVVQDGSFSKNSTTKELQFIVDNVPLRISFVTADAAYKVFQGKTLHVQFQSNKPLKEAYIETLSQRYACVQEAENSPVYECFVPIRSDENPSEHLFTVYAVDPVGTVATLSSKLQVVMYPFKKQFIGKRDAALKKDESGLPEAQFEIDIAKVSKQSPAKKIWKSAFYVPCDMTSISTAYGTLRTAQERGKYRHDALDLLAPPKSLIWASQDGVVALKEQYVHAGKTIALDHGCGVISIYFHLDDFADIKLGDMVKKGKPIGRLGMTGYATGYHLHWELRVGNVPVDPMQWTTYDF
jgi:murein DD-endopeptidase MepM/ murein hydrolase activator NlpD